MMLKETKIHSLSQRDASSPPPAIPWLLGRQGRGFLGLLLVSLLLLQWGCSRHAGQDRMFEDVTLGSGLDGYSGMTHGAAWGDYDGDGLPDLYVSNHLNNAKLFRNLGKGHFADVTSDVFKPDDIGGDKHGAAWADFDNDGRLDLVQLTGGKRGLGEEPKHLFHNLGGHFEDVAKLLGVDNPIGRSRTPLWVDLNGDGRLDLFEGAEERNDKLVQPFIFMQVGNHFIDATDKMRPSGKSAPFCIVTVINNEAHLDVVCRVVGDNLSTQEFDLSSLPARDLRLLPVSAFEDIAAADFDNDGAMDLFLARKNPPGILAFGRPGSNEMIADTHFEHATQGKTVEFSFHSSGFLQIQVAPMFPKNLIGPDRIFIGGHGLHPKDFSFALSSETAGVDGVAPHTPGESAGVYIGLTAPGTWKVIISSARISDPAKKMRFQQIALKVSSTEAIEEVQAAGDATHAEEAPARLFMNHAGKLVEESDKRGVNKQPVSAVDVVAGDFDNDMNVDLFVLASGDVGKQENLLLHNMGDGHFEVVPDAGGASGSRIGVGDSVTTADFDGDGFLDLLVATGGSMGRSLGLPSDNGGYHLYHNLGNGNHWLEIDLEGSRSNRDGIGAVVRLSAGGVTQTRVQDGGIHHRGQNFSRLHFGLAKYSVATRSPCIGQAAWCRK